MIHEDDIIFLLSHLLKCFHTAHCSLYVAFKTIEKALGNK